MSEYIHDLILEGEHQTLDFKHSITDSKKIARSLAAFANTEGGRLLVGVRDNGSIAGMKSEEEYYMIQAAADLYCKPSVGFESKVHKFEGKSILEVEIPKLESDKLVTAPNKEGKYKVYIRVNDQNLIVNNIYLKAWNKKRFGKGVLIRYSNEERVLFEYLEKNQEISLSRFCKISGLSKFKAEKVLINLIVLDLVKINFSENSTLYSLNNKEKAESRQ